MPGFWNVRSALRDHATILAHLPSIIAAPLSLTPAEGETAHLTMNAVNKCRYCTGLHVELGRMAGIPASELNGSKSEAEACLTVPQTGSIAKYSYRFAAKNGERDETYEDFKALAKDIGLGKARQVKALCWFLHWGSTAGNTLDNLYNIRLRGNAPPPGSSLAFELAFAVYYTPLFLAIVGTTKLLDFFPSDGPKIVNTVLGVVLACIAGVWIVPLGVLGGAARLFL